MLLPISLYALPGTVIDHLPELEGIHLEVKARKVVRALSRRVQSAFF